MPTLFFSGSPFSDQPVEEIKGIIQKSLRAFSGPVISRQGQIWASCSNQYGFNVANYQYGQAVYMGLQNGIAGVLYSVARTGNNISGCREIYSANLQYLQDHFLSRPQQLPGGLFGGSAGVALALAEGIKNGFIEANERNTDMIRQSLNIAPGDMSLSAGAAGIGLSVLSCISIFEPSEIKALAENQAGKILGTLANYKSSYWTDGASGIITFLILYHDRYKDSAAGLAAQNGLRWLAKQAFENKKNISPWLYNGTAGIALCFLKAFEVFQDEKYAAAAERLLLGNPKYFSTHLFTHGCGLAGLGEVYLEAHKILSGSQWLDRANWIAHILTNTCKRDGQGGVFWATHPGNMITADFGDGCAGIVHFLNRCSRPAEFGFPFLPSINSCL